MAIATNNGGSGKQVQSAAAATTNLMNAQLSLKAATTAFNIVKSDKEKLAAVKAMQAAQIDLQFATAELATAKKIEAQQAVTSMTTLQQQTAAVSATNAADIKSALDLKLEAEKEVGATKESLDAAVAASGKSKLEYDAGKEARDAAKKDIADRLAAKIKLEEEAVIKAEAAANAKKIADAKAIAAKIANDKASGLKAASETAKKTATDAILAAQVSKTAEADALVVKLQEEARVAALAAADAAGVAAAKDAEIADTATKLADATRALEAANAGIATATAASAAAVAAAAAGINKSGNVAIDTASISDTASAMYEKELKDKTEKEKILLERKSVSDIMTERFKQYGLESLAGAVRNLAIEGANEATITLALQETPEYKERFKANQARIKANLRVLSPSEYLNNEDAYRLTLREYGLTQYDTDEYVTKFIENDTSPEELSGRVSTAVNRIQNADPMIIKTLKDYGLTDTDLLGYVLDTKNKLPEITKKIQTAEVGAAARAQGLNIGTSAADLARYEQQSAGLVTQGVDQAAAQKGYSAIATYLPTAEKLSGIYDNLDGYGQTQAEQEVFGKLASAQRAREALTQREIASFSGSAGTTKGSLGSKASGLI